MMKLDIEFKESNSNFQSNFGELKVINGKSAYEIAVEEGFIGTIDEWLESLHGADGYTPIKGIDYFDGENGADGKTPIRGVDYWTDADKAEMVQAVLDAMPTAEGGAY